MKNIKQLLIILLVGTALFSLAACGQSNDQTAPDSEQQETAADSSKVLVAYYSATGNTERVAQTLADELNADLFEITPATPYTAEDLDWNVEDSRVNREHNDESLRDIELVTTEVANWDNYDTVFIGYPIWWGIAAWPVNNFVKDNDFNGKTVIPFATSSSSDLGQSGELLAETANGGTWQDGQRFSGSADQTEITAWVNGLNLGN